MHKRVLAQPITALGADYEAVVVGSGYGAGVVSSRLARMGLQTCVLERGREYVPGQFPTSLYQGAREFQITTARGRIGPKQGLFDLRLSSDLSMMVGCGVGGTSLINGNVMLRPEDRVFEDPVWPSLLRAEVNTTLQVGFERAENMLRPGKYSGPAVRKSQALRAAAASLDAPFRYAPLAVNFDAPEKGRLQPSCTLCGDCCSGCNEGAKNTISNTYLPDAVDHGAEIFSACRVQYIERAPDGGWHVLVEPHNAATSEQKRIHARHLFLCAGTLGSTEILLRSAQRGLDCSSQLGKGVSGNGDVIAFGYNNNVEISGIGVGGRTRPSTSVVGPATVSMLDLRTDGDLDDNLIIQDGAIPGILAPLLPGLMLAISALSGVNTRSGAYYYKLKRACHSLLKGAYAGAVRNTQTYLVMGHDGGGAEIVLDGKGLQVSCPKIGYRPIYETIDATLQKLSAALGGTHVANPSWSKLLGRGVISVHPLGGCCMAQTTEQGVTDDRSSVFRRDGSTHDGLYVVDGSVVPRSLGVNPALTITALAERAMIHFAAERSMQLNVE